MAKKSGTGPYTTDYVPDLTHDRRPAELERGSNQKRGTDISKLVDEAAAVDGGASARIAQSRNPQQVGAHDKS